MALALGLNTTAFTIFNAYVLRPNAVRDPHSLFDVRYFDKRGRWHGYTWSEFQSLRAVRPAAESFAVHHLFVRLEGTPVFASLASGETFRVLGAPVHLGRALLPEDDATSAPVVVLSYDLWRSRFGADSMVLGRQLVVRGIPLTIVGVLSKRFQGISSVPPDFWAPLALIERLEGPELRVSDPPAHLRVVVRLGRDERESQARAQLTTWAARITANRVDSLRATTVQLTSLATALPLDSSETVGMFGTILGAFGLVLLIACANIANVMLARGLARQRELGIRLALGAERYRLVRQLLTESVLLAVPAAALGCLISRWTVDLGVRAMFASIPGDFSQYLRVIPLTPDWRVFVFILGVAMAAALLFGLLPAIQATRPSIVQASRGDFDTVFRPNRLRNALVVAQVTVCAMLLICTGVLVRGAQRARSLETGVASSNVLQLYLDERTRQAATEVVRKHPAVRMLAGSTAQPVDGSFPTTAVRSSGRQGAAEQVAYNFVSERYFATLGISVVRGRGFTDQETRAGSPVAVVSEAFAQRLFPGTDAVGQTVQLMSDPTAGSDLDRVRTARVVGVASNAVSGWIGTGLERPVIYFPKSLEAGGMALIAKVDGNEQFTRARIDADVQRALGPGSSPIAEIHALNDFLAAAVYPFRAFSWVASALGAIALILTLGGIYGVLSYLVTQRTREIGIRMALGATVHNIVRLVVRQSFVLALVGLVTGAGLALVVSRLFSTVLFVVNTYDAVGYAAGAAVVVLAAAAAAYGPVRRACAIDPALTLKGQ